MSERNTIVLLNDIAESIHNIFEFTRGLSFDQYSTDIKTKHAVEHNFMIIGEAVSRIPSDFKNEYPNINWRQIKDFRNIIAHDYFGIDNGIVWDIIQLNLSALLEDISQIIQKETRS